MYNDESSGTPGDFVWPYTPHDTYRHVSDGVCPGCGHCLHCGQYRGHPSPAPFWTTTTTNTAVADNDLDMIALN